MRFQDAENVVVTGGAGFIGSHLVDLILARNPRCKVRILDKMTYAADERNVRQALDTGRAELARVDLADFEACRQVVQGADMVFNLAAESHVDISFGNPLLFTMTNTFGTHCLLEACRAEKTPEVLHVSTDEVYGPVSPTQCVGEDAPLNPTNPYSASKAGAELIVSSYRSSYHMNIRMVRGNNVFGPRQYPEKIIPKFITLMHAGRKMTLHGNGLYRRRYIHVEDFCSGILQVADNGREGEVYNIGSEEEYSNVEVAGLICAAFGRDLDDWTTYTTDRLFNDDRYAIDTGRIRALGWECRHRLAPHIEPMIRWYGEQLKERWPGLHS